MEDVKAFQFLFRHANIHLARKIERADLRLDFLKYFQTALKEMRMHRGRVFVHLGPVVNPDVCVLIADFLMRICSVKWAIVSGMSDSRLSIVFRNDGLRKDAGKTAKSGFGHLGSAGGHKSMARAEIWLADLEGTTDCQDAKVLSEWIIQQVETNQKKPDVAFKKEILGLK